MSNAEWYGFDLDGTLAQYDRWRGIEHIGEPIPRMVVRVKWMLAQGRDVRIFTARVCPMAGRDLPRVVEVIQAWCLENIGQVLPITHEKDFGMVELWDDRVVQVIPNTGLRADGLP